MDTNMDDADIQREITNMFIRTNLLLRKFSKCSVNVKTVLFKSYCLCLYDASLWKCFNAGTLDKLRSCYNRCIKLFFGYKRRDSMTNVFLCSYAFLHSTPCLLILLQRFIVSGHCARIVFFDICVC